MKIIRTNTPGKARSVAEGWGLGHQRRDGFEVPRAKFLVPYTVVQQLPLIFIDHTVIPAHSSDSRLYIVPKIKGFLNFLNSVHIAAVLAIEKLKCFFHQPFLYLPSSGRCMPLNALPSSKRERASWRLHVKLLGYVEGMSCWKVNTKVPYNWNYVCKFICMCTIESMHIYIIIDMYIYEYRAPDCLSHVLNNWSDTST